MRRHRALPQKARQVVFPLAKIGRTAYSQALSAPVPWRALGDAHRGARTWPFGRGEQCERARRKTPRAAGSFHYLGGPGGIPLVAGARWAVRGKDAGSVVILEAVGCD
jgi:hypothetical protein